MAHKIRVKSISNKKNSDLELFLIIFALILLVAGPAVYRVGIFLNIFNGAFALKFLILGLLLTCIGLVFLLHSKVTKHNKLLASIFCFYASFNSILLINSIDKLKIASTNLSRVYSELGIAPRYPNMEENVIIMDTMNDMFIVVFMVIAMIFLFIYIKQRYLDRNEGPSEASGP